MLNSIAATGQQAAMICFMIAWVLSKKMIIASVILASDAVAPAFVNGTSYKEGLQATWQNSSSRGTGLEL